MHIYTPANVHHATISMPDDGVDARSAMNQNSPDEALADNCKHLYARLGERYLRWETPVSTAYQYDDTDLTEQSTTTSTSYPAYAAVSGGGNLILMPASALVQATTTDIVEVEVQLLSKVYATGTAQWLQLVYSLNASTVVPIPGARLLDKDEGASVATRPVHLFGRFVVPSSTGALWLALQHKVAAGGTQGYLYSPMACRMRCWASAA